MPWKPKAKVSLVKCGTCGRSYNNPLGHVCRTGFNKTGKKRMGKPKGKR